MKVAKKAGKPAAKKTAAKKGEGMSADQHRKQAAVHRAHARLHEGRADLMEAKDPPKGKPPGYPY